MKRILNLYYDVDKIYIHLHTHEPVFWYFTNFTNFFEVKKELKNFGRQTGGARGGNLNKNSSNLILYHNMIIITICDNHYITI